MSTTPVGLRTPQRNTYNMFEEDGEEEEEEHITYNAFTPCTRLSRMTIESQSNGSRSRSAVFNSPASNFTEKLMSVVREEASSSHPNLDMFLSTDRISMSKDNQMFSFSEDEDSDEGDLFSSNLCPMFSSSPGRTFTKSSIFDDEPMHSLFDEEEDEEEQEQENHYDPTECWLSQIYSDNNEPVKSFPNNNNESSDAEEEEDQENKPPRFSSSSSSSSDSIDKMKSKRHDNQVGVVERLPLGEIRFVNQEDSDEEDNEDERHPKKKSLLADGKLLKMRYMRALSPPRYAKRKGKEPLSTIL